MFSLVCFTESNSVHSNWSDTPCEEMRSVKMIPTEEETEEQAELFSDMMQTIANEWDPYINNLKKSLPLNPDEIKEVQKKKDEMFTELDYIFCLDKSSPIVDLVLKLGRKLRYDCNFFRYYYRDHGIQPARAEQYTTAIILADLEAIEKPHPEEDNEDAAVSPFPRVDPAQDCVQVCSKAGSSLQLRSAVEPAPPSELRLLLLSVQV